MDDIVLSLILTLRESRREIGACYVSSDPTPRKFSDHDRASLLAGYFLALSDVEEYILKNITDMQESQDSSGN